MIGLLVSIIVLGILIFIHELGHFLVARLFGVGIEKFSLGFGKRIWGKTVGRTDYRISAIPLGGYVKMVGEEPDAEIPPEDIPVSFTHKNVFKRILIVAAGPTFNILLAVFIFWVIFMISGKYIYKPVIGEVEDGSPAQSAGLTPGDTVVAINDKQIGSWTDMATYIAGSGGQELDITVRRQEELKTIHVNPRLVTIKNIFGVEEDRYVVGIRPSGEGYEEKLGFFSSLMESFRYTYEIEKQMLYHIGMLIQRKISPDTLGGPIMIVQMVGQQVQYGFNSLIFLTALLSINLGILNFLPIPVLDGGHLVFFIIEAIIRRPVNQRVREIAQQTGIFVLLLLMIYVSYNDIKRVLTQWLSG